MRCHLPLLLVTLSLGCGEDSKTNFAPLEEGCQPLLAGHHCMLPYPSDYFRAEDTDTDTGYRIVVSGAAANITDDNENAELSSLYITDGFSRNPLIVGALPDVLVADGLTDILGDYSKTQSPDSKTVLLEADTGAFVAHFADVDPRAFDPLRRAIALHPIVDLKEKTRYIVALQAVQNEDGENAEAAAGFALLRDGRTSGIDEFAGLGSHFDSDIFPVLEEAGLVREDLQLAWDFTTGSDAEPMADILRIREQTSAWIELEGISLTIEEVEENPEDKPETWRRIKGKIRVPLYLENTELGSEFVRDEQDRVDIQDTTEVDFLVVVPTSARDSLSPARPLFFGHGFFGDRTELNGNLTQTISQELGTVMIAIDWWGMSSPDIVPLIEDLTSAPIRTLRFSDRVHQAMSNWMVMTSSLAVLAAQPELRRPSEGPGSGEGSLSGEPLIDEAHGISFMGISQGHILAGMLAAVLPKLDRVVLHAGGAGLSHFMFRAEAFGALMQLISRHFKRPIEQYAWAASTQRIFDRFDPGQYARYILKEPLEGASPRRVLMQMGIGDVAVPNFGTYFHARSIGLPSVSNEDLGLFEMPDVQAAESGFTSYDYGIDTDFYRVPQVPIEGNEVHDQVRIEPAVLDQIDRFLQADGMVEATCDGACDPS